MKSKNLVSDINVSELEVPHKKPVVLISCPFPGTMPWAFVYLSAYLKQHGENVIVLNRSDLISNEELVDQAFSCDPILVGIGSLYSDFQDVKDIISLFKKKGKKFPVVIGGQMVTPTPEFSLKITGADVGVIGEGEITLYNLVQAIRSNRNILEVKGLIVRRNDEFINTGEGEYVKDLSTLPEPDFSIYPTDWWINIGKFFSGSRDIVWRYSDRVVYIHSSRGCPYRCNFCYLHSKVRFRDPDEMMVNANNLLEKYDANVLSILDELVLSTPKRAQDFVNAIRKHIKRPFEYITVSRFDIIDKISDELLKDLKESGCRSIGFGFESGSPRILEIMNKRITVDQIRRGVQRLTNVGIIPTGAFQIGQYTETEEDVQMTISLMKDMIKINPNIVFGFAITTPFPGSELHDILLKEGKFKDEGDFYNQYFATCGGGLRLVANGSAMNDRVVVKWSKKIAEICQREKNKELGFTISFLELIKRSMSRLNRLFCKKVLKVHPYFYTNDKDVLVIKYRKLFDITIRFLEKISLKLRKNVF